MADILGIGSVAGLVKGVLDRFLPAKMSETERATLEIELQRMLEDRETRLLDAQKEVLVAELSQGDTYTKRARPTVVYLGLLFIALVHVVFPIVVYTTGQPLPTLALPDEFWWAWSGVVGTWMIGRTMEKRGAQGGLVDIITGKKPALGK